MVVAGAYLSIFAFAGSSSLVYQMFVYQSIDFLDHRIGRDFQQPGDGLDTRPAFPFGTGIGHQQAVNLKFIGIQLQVEYGIVDLKKASSHSPSLSFVCSRIH